MISATIKTPFAEGSQVIVPYVLTDDQDPNYSFQGRLSVTVGASVDTINAQIAVVVDTANYASSLLPLSNTKVQASKPKPDPVIVPVVNSLVLLLITLVAGKTAIAGVQFDLALPTGTSFVSATASAGTLAAGKSVSTNMIDTTTLRVIVFGLNQTALASGDLLTLQLNGNSAGVAASSVVMTDPSGKTVTDGSITLG